MTLLFNCWKIWMKNNEKKFFDVEFKINIGQNIRMD